MTRVRLFAVACAMIAQTATAQSPTQFDRTKAPAVAPTPAFVLPGYSVDTLANGVRVVVVERHNLPIVELSLHFQSGTNQMQTRPGVSGFLTSMLREGTDVHSAEQITDALTELGSSVMFSFGPDSGRAEFQSLSRSFDGTLGVMMDMMLHSTYPATSMERLRTQSLSAYVRGQDAVNTVAAQVAPVLLYGNQPYGIVANDSDLNSVTRDDVANLAKQFFVANNVIAYVVGDVRRAAVKRTLEAAFKEWKIGQVRKATYAAAPAAGPTTVYFIDMPNKAQSQLMFAHAVVPAFSPDMAKLDVTNAIAGGMFASRLNTNIREAKGYSYAFNSRVSWTAGPGSFRAQGAVTREKTDSAMLEGMKELRGLQGTVPATNDELLAAKRSRTLTLPAQLQTIDATTVVVSRVVDHGLANNWWARYVAEINATTASDVAAMSAKYLDPARMIVLVVGDKAKILESVRAAAVGPVVEVDKRGKVVGVGWGGAQVGAGSSMLGA